MDKVVCNNCCKTLDTIDIVTREVLEFEEDSYVPYIDKAITKYYCPYCEHELNSEEIWSD